MSRGDRAVLIAKSAAAIVTMLGPAGVSNAKAPASPPRAERLPIMTAIPAIASGVRANGRAVAAGITSIAAISNAPTTLI